MTATVMGFSFAWSMIQVAYNDFTSLWLRCVWLTEDLRLK